jgi:uncharacterized protein YeaO (DUF488 family)
MKRLKFARDFTKLNDEVFSTIRPAGKFEVDDDVMVERPGHDPRQGKVIFIFTRTLDQIPDEFLCHDTDTNSRIEATALLASFYPDMDSTTIWNIVRVKYTGPKGVRDNIHLDCYMAIEPRMQQEHLDADFEIITRQKPPFPVTGNAAWAPLLSPSWELLKRAKAEHLPLEQYGELLLSELVIKPEAMALMQAIYETAQRKIVFLVCFEKDPNQCHRSLMKRWIMEHAGGKL